MNKRCIVTGGAGFIGSALVRLLVKETESTVLVVDKLTYAGVPESLKEVGLDPETLGSSNPRLSFLRADICDQSAMDGAFASFRPDTIYHLAAESHVDRSIDGPGEFVRTNVTGTATLLQAALKYWKSLDASAQAAFRFQHISTDEVYGTLGETGFFTEKTPYSPHSPYSASKAASDHLVRAWHDTYGLPTLITNCSNNYGPYHFPEKLIPLIVLNCLDGKPLPVYGKGANVRDWLYVEDHARALMLVNEKGAPGETYNVGGHNERTNLEVVKTVCAILDELKPRSAGRYEDLITYVADRPGHDLRYAIDPTKLMTELGWKPRENFETGIRRTVQWYLDNEWWWRPIREKKYSGQRLGRGGDAAGVASPGKSARLFSLLPSLLLLLAFLVSGCRRTDVREMTISMPGLVEADKAKVVEALSKYAGVEKGSYKWDMAAKTLTLRYDSMQIAQANIRYAIDEKGVKVAFPEKTDERAGY